MAAIRYLGVWIVEFVKLLVTKLVGGQRLHPLLTQCPICQQKVRLHVDNSGRRHVFAHARGLYEGCRIRVHYVARIKCDGSGALLVFDPHPNEHQRFKLPEPLREG